MAKFIQFSPDGFQITDGVVDKSDSSSHEKFTNGKELAERACYDNKQSVFTIAPVVLADTECDSAITPKRKRGRPPKVPRPGEERFLTPQEPVKKKRGRPFKKFMGINFKRIGSDTDPVARKPRHGSFKKSGSLSMEVSVDDQRMDDLLPETVRHDEESEPTSSGESLEDRDDITIDPMCQYSMKPNQTTAVRVSCRKRKLRVIPDWDPIGLIASRKSSGGDDTERPFLSAFTEKAAQSEVKKNEEKRIKRRTKSPKIKWVKPLKDLSRGGELAAMLAAKRLFINCDTNEKEDGSNEPEPTHSIGESHREHPYTKPAMWSPVDAFHPMQGSRFGAPGANSALSGVSMFDGNDSNEPADDVDLAAQYVKSDRLRVIDAEIRLIKTKRENLEHVLIDDIGRLRAMETQIMRAIYTPGDYRGLSTQEQIESIVEPRMNARDELLNSMKETFKKMDAFNRTIHEGMLESLDLLQPSAF